MSLSRSRVSEDHASAFAEGPRKRIKVLLDDESSSDDSETSGGVALNQKSTATDGIGFKVNEKYAQRFEHNQKRAELHQCICYKACFSHKANESTVEEKYGKDSKARRLNGYGGDANGMDDDYDSTSSSEEEDDDGVLASGILDKEVNATLEAIRRKDPRVYDEKTTFYTAIDDEDGDSSNGIKNRDKPMYLNDYHRENLLKGVVDDDEAMPTTYSRQQDTLRSAIVQEMHAAAKHLGTSISSHTGSEDEDVTDFLVKKPSVSTALSQGVEGPIISSVDIETADKDPETYLSNFMAARAWVPSAGVKFQPFESDDEDEDKRAEAFEEAYNLRFEDPQVSNEKLLSHARDTAAKYSVRKEAINSRKRAREAEQAQKEAAKHEREQEKARLRKLKVEGAEEKVKRIKEAAGIRGRALDIQEWSAFLLEDWDHERWEAEMQKRFGEGYYADQEQHTSDVEDTDKKRKLKKPKWEDDIDITDILPDFNDDNEQVRFGLLDDSDNDGADTSDALDISKKRKTNKKHKEEQKREARKERRRIEQMVDEKINIDLALNGSSSSDTRRGPFRYRETSPLAYGLTPRDILLASDGQLNQYAGLKKMAAFRDAEKKKRDKKHLGKKARLRQWRKETFGNEQGPQKSLQEVLAEQASANEHGLVSAVGEGEPGVQKSKKRKRSEKTKAFAPAFYSTATPL